MPRARKGSISRFLPRKKVYAPKRVGEYVGLCVEDVAGRQGSLDARNLPSQGELVSGVAPQRERQQYTGDYVIGIGVMHKSNLIPITNGDQAVDIAKMRRN